MAERSLVWTTNATGDGTSGGYSAANWVQMTRQMFITNPATEGVLYGIGNNLAVTGSASPVAVNTGSGLVYGIWYENDSSINVTIPTPASNPRIDRVVMRANWAAQTVRITRIAGTEAASPIAPALTQTANTTWDIPLYQVRITTGGVITLTDERAYCKHPGVYGWLQQANTWVGNQSVTGALSATGAISGGAGLQIATGAETTGLGAAFTLSGWGRGFTMPNSAVVMWPRGASGNARAIGVTNNGDLYVMRSTANDNSAAATYDMSIDQSGNVSFPTGGLNASQLLTGTVPLGRLSGITGSQLATDSVDDTIVGNRVPQFYRRQGGSATDWSNPGTTNYTPAAVRMQSGVATVTSGGPFVVTFPVAFSYPPIILCAASQFGYNVNCASVNNSTATFYSWYVNPLAYGISQAATQFSWLAIGPE